MDFQYHKMLLDIDKACGENDRGKICQTLLAIAFLKSDLIFTNIDNILNDLIDINIYGCEIRNITSTEKINYKIEVKTTTSDSTLITKNQHLQLHKSQRRGDLSYIALLKINYDEDWLFVKENLIVANKKLKYAQLKSISDKNLSEKIEIPFIKVLSENIYAILNTNKNGAVAYISKKFEEEKNKKQ